MAETQKKLCPFKKATTTEKNGMTGSTTTHERFEECAGSRCMAYSQRRQVCRLTKKEDDHGQRR